MKWLERVCYAAAPAFLYFIGSNLLYILLKYGLVLLTKSMSGLELQFIVELCCFVVIGLYYKTYRNHYESTVQIVQKPGPYRFAAYFGYIVSAVVFAIFGNMIIAWARAQLPWFSTGYGHVEQMFYRQDLLLELLALGFLGPLLEELLYRGIVLVRFQTFFSIPAAIAGSAFLFGALHLNLVQGTYATGMGILFGYIYWKTGKLWVCVAAHMAANLFAVLQTEYGSFSFFFENLLGRVY